MQMFFIIAVIVLLFLVIFQISKAAEYVSVLKGEEQSRKQTNKVNAFLMLGFMIVGLIGVWYCNKLYAPQTLMLNGGPASEQGIKVDEMLYWTLAITGVVFVLTQIVLFWFAYKYQEKEGNKVYFFPHNNKLEMVWTVIPAIFLAILVVIGLRNWMSFTSEAPANALQVEVTGKQFGWIFRYSGNDKQFGKKYYRLIDNATNSLGLVWRDTSVVTPNGGDLKAMKADKYAQDDIVMEQTMYVVVNEPVKLIINSRDVIHDVGLNHFRLKMDAVPGMPTTLWFTPIYTTKQMQERTNNPNFKYEISCDQMCGNGHYSMKGNIEVVTKEEYREWMKKQVPTYVKQYVPQVVTPTVDTAKTVAAVVKK